MNDWNHRDTKPRNLGARIATNNKRVDKLQKMNPDKVIQELESVVQFRIPMYSAESALAQILPYYSRNIDFRLYTDDPAEWAKCHCALIDQSIIKIDTDTGTAGLESGGFWVMAFRWSDVERFIHEFFIGKQLQF